MARTLDALIKDARLPEDVRGHLKNYQALQGVARALVSLLNNKWQLCETIAELLTHPNTHVQHRERAPERNMNWKERKDTEWKTYFDVTEFARRTLAERERREALIASLRKTLGVTDADQQESVRSPEPSDP
jgi:hypothetical protein